MFNHKLYTMLWFKKDPKYIPWIWCTNRGKDQHSEYYSVKRLLCALHIIDIGPLLRCYLNHSVTNTAVVEYFLYFEIFWILDKCTVFVAEWVAVDQKCCEQNITTCLFACIRYPSKVGNLYFVNKRGLF